MQYVWRGKGQHSPYLHTCVTEVCALVPYTLNVYEHQQQQQQHCQMHPCHIRVPFIAIEHTPYALTLPI